MPRRMGLVITQEAIASLRRFQHKVRAQLIRKVKALILNPYPPGSKKLKGFTTECGEGVYRQRSGDYRILYVVRGSSNEVIVLDIDNRKDVYRVTKKDKVKVGKSEEKYRMKADDFDKMMGSALDTPSKPTKNPIPSKKKRKGPSKKR